jgi:hypothetical protein
MREMTFTGKNLNLMASTLLDVFRSRRLQMYKHDALVADLSRLTIEEKAYGYRLSAIRNEHGHCDLATALAIALPIAVGEADNLPNILQVMFGPGASDYTSTTPFAQHVREFEERQREYEEEQRQHAQWNESRQAQGAAIAAAYHSGQLRNPF